jgi:hypothetical protein
MFSSDKTAKNKRRYALFSCYIVKREKQIIIYYFVDYQYYNVNKF